MTAAQLAALHRRRAAAVPREFERTSNRLKVLAVKFCREVLTREIYAMPIPTREQINAERRHASGIASGRIPADMPFSFTPTAKRRRKGAEKAWKRTGHLRRSERAELDDPYTVRVVNDAEYAEDRHEMGKPGNRKARFPSHWRDELLKWFAPLQLKLHEETMRRLLEMK